MERTSGLCLARALGVFLAAVVLCLGTASASASPGLAVEDHTFPTPAVDAAQVNAAFAPNGFGALAWVETLTGKESRVDVSLRPPGGNWSVPQPLSATVKGVNNVHVTVDGAGDAGVAWEETESPSTFIAAVAKRPGGGTFGTPETFTNGFSPRVGIDSSGNLTLLYAIVNSGPQNGEFVRTAPVRGSLTTASPHTLSSSCWAFDADLAVAPSGDAIAGFACSTEGSFALRTGGSWGATSTPFIGSLESCPAMSQTFFGGVRVAIDSQGHPVGVLGRTNRTHECPIGLFNIESRAILLAVPAGGVMSAGPTVAESGASFGLTIPHNVTGETVGIGGGTVVVAWMAADESGVQYQTATRSYPSNGAGAPDAIQTLGDPKAPASGDQVSVNPSGETLLTWSASSGGKVVPFAAFRPTGGAFGPALVVSGGAADASSVSSAIDDAGDGVIGWLEAQGTTHVAHARGFDSTPPQLSGVSIPATAQAGIPAAFSAQAFDVWGPVSLLWSYGDGTAGGASPSHTFAAAGQHTVTVTATDSVGNAVSQQGSVAVTPPPAPRPTILSVSGVRQSAGRWREGNQLARFTRAKYKPPVGTIFSFTLNMPAAARLDFTQGIGGRKVSGRCVAQTKRNRRRARCKRTLTIGTLGFAAHAGTNEVRFQGRVSRTRRLKAGRYTLVITATSPSGARSLPQPLSFTIVK